MSGAMNGLIDTHAHLNDEAFAPAEIPAVVERAQAAGVGRIIVPGYDLPSSRRAVELAEAFPGLYATVGVHPHQAAEAPPYYLAELRALARGGKVVALGEIGLDYHYAFSPREIQLRAFQEQLELAGELSLPVVIHDREAHADTLRLLVESQPPAGGVLHCYSGSLELAEQLLPLGLRFSFGGAVTFPNARRLLEVVRGLPAEALLLETDSPYLAPVPQRGRRNEPAYLKLVAERVAELRGWTPEELALRTTANARAAFPALAAQ
ncbi:MAG: TatD family hydrolase [Bacillota bacterium]|nr:TatD family hydrolase [Bacillota bacterium]